MFTKSISSLPAGTNFSRIVQLAAVPDTQEARLEKAAVFRDTPGVEAFFAARRDLYGQKSSVNAGTMTDPDWAAALRQTGQATEFLGLTPQFFVFDKLKTLGTREVPFLTPTPKENGSAVSGSWAGAGAGIALKAGSFDSVQLVPYIAGVMQVVSKELVLKFGNRAAEATLRNCLLRGLAAFIDRALFDATASAMAGGENPGPLVDEATVIASTGTTAAQILADLASLIAAITSGSDRLVWVLRPKTYYTIVAKLAAVGLSVRPGTLLEIPVVLSSNVPAQITLIDADKIVYADDGIFEVQSSQQASVQMESEPTNASETGGSPAGPFATTLVSLYQTNTAAIKILRWLSWQRVRDGAVSYMAVTY